MRDARSLTALATALVLLLGGPAAHGQAQPIKISNVWARRAAMAHADMGTPGKDKDAMGSMGQKGADKGGMSHMAGQGATSAVYLTVDNAGPRADALVSASSDVAKTTELHEVRTEEGVKMRPVEKIPLPAGGKVELKPGGYHVMLIGLTRDLKPGDIIPVTLTFELGGEMRVEATVK